MEAYPPIGENGDFSTERHHQWIEKQMELERMESVLDTAKDSVSAQAQTASSTENIISDMNITMDDVLFGREKKIVNHPGNTRFRQLVDMYISSYDAAPRNEKVTITKFIIDQVHLSSGRFLKRADAGGWVEVSEEVAHDKISHGFRNRRKYLASSKKAGPCGPMF
jgi:hypothetical protein